MPGILEWFDAGTFESMHQASSFIKTIQKRQGLQIACIEEIAYVNGWVTKEQVVETYKKNSYGQHLLNLIK